MTAKSDIHKDIFNEYERLVSARLKDPNLDNSKEMEVLHMKLNDVILGELGMKNTFGYYESEVRKDTYGE
jgi:hypothetical protein